MVKGRRAGGARSVDDPWNDLYGVPYLYPESLNRRQTGRHPDRAHQPRAPA